MSPFILCVRHLFRIVLFAFILFSLSACRYYKVTVPENNRAALTSLLKDSKKYIILRQGELSWHLTDIKLSDTSEQIICRIEAPNAYHKKCLKANLHSTKRYRKKLHGNPDNEIHLYIDVYRELSSDRISFSTSNIYRTVLFKKAKGATLTSYFYGFGSAATILFITILTAVENFSVGIGI